ncbi:folylpolyglutamate synthase [Geosmithia morbida]|uniref:Folylpolyglutamate synthase n=1 Tax=Geosmithia morbida TaxID=1094350 RepID=A0A9P4Z0B9_9HYPO|nr:folylpolyglutamate synthase [Geosmithia morbida]KAF4125081.1 folylpolyglutamate synthase [Geosmithia morbida]
MATAGRSYNDDFQDAIDTLNSLQTPYHIIEARRKAGIRPGANSVREMRAYLGRIGYSLSDLDRLNIIHVAGTKGKGSTCAFVDAILSQAQHAHGRPHKTGLFISPHLIAVRERIRINSTPISEGLFTKYFFDVWDRLEKATVAANDDIAPGSKPAYSRYLTLMSWHVFLQEGVDAAVYETGIGGEFDATNLVERPVATGITTLGIDHVFALGDTVDKIAWHKAGIIKKDSPAFTVKQVPEAEKVVLERATEKSVDLKVLSVDPRLQGVRIRPDTLFQKNNASLAIALAETALAKIDGRQSNDNGERLPETFVRGLEGVVFRGRCEVKVEDNVTWHVDGAHTVDSLRVSSEWFAEETAGRTGPRVMIFNQQARSEAVSFFKSIHKATKRVGRPAFDHAIFCTNVTYAGTGYKRDFVNHQYNPEEIKDLVVQHRFAEKWASLDPDCNIRVVPTIEQAINLTREFGARSAEKADALITGSFHLVGGALGMLEDADAL